MSGKLVELRDSVKSLKRTQRVIHVNEVSTMSRIHKLLKKAERAVSYRVNVLRTLSQLSERLGLSLNNQNNTSKENLLIVVTSNRGFCGAYNQDVLAKINEVLPQIEGRPKVIVIGKQGHKFLQDKNCEIVEFIDRPIESVSLEDTAELTSRILNGLDTNEYGKVSIVYTQYIDAMHSEVCYTELYPEVPHLDGDMETKEFEISGIVDYDEDEDDIMSLLIENYLCGLIYSMLVYSVASEYCARRKAIRLANDAIEERLRKVIYQERKEHLQVSTRELFDIITSANALKEDLDE